MSDLISRECAINAVALEIASMFDVTTYDGHEIAEHALSSLPSAEGGDAEMNEVKSPYMQYSPDGADLISRADAIEAVRKELVCDGRHETHDKTCRFIADVLLSALPSAEAPTGELILRADAIELLTEIVFDEPPYFDSETLCRLYAEEQINTLPSAEIAETEPIVIRSKTLLPTKDFKEWAKRIREVNPNAVVIPCDAEVASAEAVSFEDAMQIRNTILFKEYMRGRRDAEAVQGWIPFTRRPITEEEQKDYPNCTFMFDCVLPNDGEEILVSNRRFVWIDTFCSDIDGCYLDGGDDIDEDMAWMPLPKPYREDGEA